MLTLLVVLAFVFSGVLTIYFALLAVGLRWFGIRQFFNDDITGLEQEAAEQNQEDDYQTLISLGFNPIGRYRETVGVFDRSHDEIVMFHGELPVYCHLKMLANRKVIVELLSEDSNGNFIVTTTRKMFEQEEQRLLLQSRGDETPEQLFEDHVLALDALEENGFAVTVAGMRGYAELRKRYFQLPKVQTSFRNDFWSHSIGCVLFTFVFPAWIGSIALTLALRKPVMPFVLSMDEVWAIFAVTSLLASGLMLRSSIMKPSKRNAKRSTFAPADSAEPAHPVDMPALPQPLDG